MHNLPSHVKIVEVGPRDGLQNEPQLIPTSIKIAFINQLSLTGLSAIEVTSFVSPQAIPQLADHHEVFEGINKAPGIHYSALVPNRQGLENAIQAGVHEIALFTAASETFSQKNIRCSIQESFQRFEEVALLAKQQGIQMRGYISCVLGCPYEGKIATSAVLTVARLLHQLGCYEISLGDTIGVGTANAVTELIEQLSVIIPLAQLAVHFHDTYGQALVNIYAALLQGITVIDSAISGLGGCPYAPGASGNVATEDVLYMLNGLGIHTGVDLPKIIKAGQFICEQLNKPTCSKVAQVYQKKAF